MKRYELLKQAINNHGYCSVDKQNMDMIEKEIRADERAELLEKVAEKIKEYSGLHYVDCDGYFGGEKELIFKVDDWLDEIITELKAEIE